MKSVSSGRPGRPGEARSCQWQCDGCRPNLTGCRRKAGADYYVRLARLILSTQNLGPNPYMMYTIHKAPLTAPVLTPRDEG